MKQILGMLILLIAVCVLTTAIEPKFAGSDNVSNLIQRTALFSIIGIGVAFVIITGGIDLSIGSLAALVGCLLPMFLAVEFITPDVSHVLDISGDGSIEMSAPNDTLNPGDKVQFTDGYTIRDRLFTISEVNGANLRIAEKPGGSDQQGRLVPAYPVTRIDVEGAAFVTAGDFSWLKREDKIAYFASETSRERSYIVEETRFDAAAGETTIGLRQQPTDGEQPGWFIPMSTRHMNTGFAVFLVLLIAAGLGLVHGLLITKVKLQPFVVTLCGLLIYRGLARFITRDKVMGFGEYFSSLKFWAQGNPFSIPMPFLDRIAMGNWGSYWVNPTTGEQVLVKVNAAGEPILDSLGQPIIDAAGAPLELGWITWVSIPMPAILMVVIAMAAIILLNYTIFGRYLFALGNNETAARYSGINTDRMVILAYVICAFLAGLAGVLFVLYLNQTQPATSGTFLELYAITAAVLGGCSLRGGQGTIIGVVIGAALMQVLYNSINMVGIPTQLEPAIIGLVLLIGVGGDETIKRISAHRRTAREAAASGRDTAMADTEATEAG